MLESSERHTKSLLKHAEISEENLAKLLTAPPYRGTITVTIHDREEGRNAMKWKRRDLAMGIGSPLYAYEAHGETGKWRITKEDDGTWSVRRMKPNEMRYRVYMRCNRLWEAKFRAEKRDESEAQG